MSTNISVNGVSTRIKLYEELYDWVDYDRPFIFFDNPKLYQYIVLKILHDLTNPDYAGINLDNLYDIIHLSECIPSLYESYNLASDINSIMEQLSLEDELLDVPSTSLYALRKLEGKKFAEIGII